MKSCKQFQEMIWLDIYGELSDEQKSALKSHMKSCAECQLDYEEALKTSKLFNKKVQLEPNENIKKEMRNELHQRLLLIKQPHLRLKWSDRLWQIVSLDFAPTVRMGTALALLIIGAFIGSQYFRLVGGKSAYLSKEPVMADSHVAGMESIHFDPETKKVEITLSTMRDITVEGNLNKPEIQKLMARALIADERPNIRLRTVKALENSNYLGKEVLDALVEIIEQEKNPGIRLRALKVLTTVPITPAVKSLMAKVLVKVLLSDENSAMRIEAFNELNKVNNNVLDSKLYDVVKSDSSEYIRTQSSHILDRTENPTFLK